jgi:hypothetical protein
MQLLGMWLFGFWCGAGAAFGVSLLIKRSIDKLDRW